MKKTFFILITFSVVSLLSCKNEKPSDSKSSTATTPSVVATPNGFYKHFKGTVDSFAVTMDLVQIHNKVMQDAPYNFRGNYYYDKYQQPIALYGELDSVGNIVLHEANFQDKDIYFKGKLDASGSFSGTWRDTASKRELPFVLKETYADGAITFDFNKFEDSIKLWKDKPGTPIATYNIEALLPAKNTEGGVASFLKDRIFGSFNSDTLEKSYANVTLESLKNTQRDTFFKIYHETLKDETPESMGASMNYAESHTQYILFNEKDLLSVGYSTYEYSGGVHGNHATSLATYDLAQKKTVKLNDIFLPKFEKTVNAALAKAVRKQFGLKPNEPLSTSLFENSIQFTDNFCITKKGILFLYNPYEIAAYAYGEIELFVPFEDIKTVVNPRFLQ